MPTDTLRADCTRCAALCCVALAFDRSALFAYDKRAGEPCRHLGHDGRCAVHASRQEAGFAGCVGYDCLGAGQFVTQIVFGGRSWRDDALLLRPMITAFAVVRGLRSLLALLGAEHLAAPAGLQRRRAALIEELRLGEATTMGALMDPSLALRMREARDFLASLRPAARRAPTEALD
jgi:hypothetical protein